VAVVFNVVQIKQIKIDTHKRNNKKHNSNDTKHSKYKYTYYQNTHIIVKTSPHTLTDTLKKKFKNHSTRFTPKEIVTTQSSTPSKSSP